MKFKDIVSQTSVQEPKIETNPPQKTRDFGFCLMNLILLKSMKAHRVLETIVSIKLLSVWTERDRVSVL